MNSQKHSLVGIINAIASHPQQRATFAEFMELALYHPECGYYSAGNVAIGGEGGDFFTSASLGADLGELLAEQFVEFWEILGKPRPFTLLEMGAGTGAIAGDILHHCQQDHADFFASLEYIIVEKSAALQARQQEHLAPWRDEKITWKNWPEIADNSILGCAFSNELVDALPVHLVELVGDRLQEIYVTYQDGRFVELRGELSTPALTEYFQAFGIEFPSVAYPEGYRTEVNLAAYGWLATVARKLQQGYLLTIDYGYSAAKYYHPQRHQGTLQCHDRHRRHADPYLAVGAQDITAHVNFTALELHGDRLGLNRLGFTRQGLFLMALGLGDRLATLAQDCKNPAELFRRRDALHQLIDPMGLGGFGVLLQGKKLTAKQLERLPRGFIEPELHRTIS